MGWFCQAGVWGPACISADSAEGPSLGAVQRELSGDEKVCTDTGGLAPLRFKLILLCFSLQKRMLTRSG